VNDRPLPTPGPNPIAAKRRFKYPHIGPVRLTPPLIVVLVVLIGSLVFIGYVMANVRDQQIPFLAGGFTALGASFAAIAIGALMGMWRAASRADSRRAFILALVGGLAGLGAIGSFSVAALLTMVLNT
jgi:ABC-type Co2+ transport system permease subunit